MIDDSSLANYWVKIHILKSLFSEVIPNSAYILNEIGEFYEILSSDLLTVINVTNPKVEVLDSPI